MDKLILILFVGLGVWGVGSCASYLGETAQMEQQIKDKNKKFLKEKVLVETDSAKRGFSDRISMWIDQKIDKENQDVFKAFAARIKDCTESADTGEDFRDHERDLVYYPFCVQGDKDIKLFEEFAQEVVYESPLQRKLLEMARKKHDRNQKVQVPSEYEINDFCGFKN